MQKELWEDISKETEAPKEEKKKKRSGAYAKNKGNEEIWSDDIFSEDNEKNLKSPQKKKRSGAYSKQKGKILT